MKKYKSVKKEMFLKYRKEFSKIFIGLLMLVSTASAFAGADAISAGDKKAAEKKAVKKVKAISFNEKVTASARSLAKHLKTGSREKSATLNKKAANSRAGYLVDKPLYAFTNDQREYLRDKLDVLRKKPSTRLFLDTVQEGEDGGTHVMVGRRYLIFGKECRVRNLDRHPGEVLPPKCFYWSKDKRGRRTFSTAAGKYQLTRQNWRIISPFLKLKDFSEKNQERSILELLRRGGGARSKTVTRGFLDLERGDVNGAIRHATRDFASSTFSPLKGRKTNYLKIAEKLRRTGSYGPANSTKKAARQRRKN